MGIRLKKIEDVFSLDFPKMGPITSEVIMRNDRYYNPYLSQDQIISRQKKRDWNFRVHMAELDKGTDKRNILYGNPFEQTAYTIKYIFMNIFSKPYRCAQIGF